MGRRERKAAEEAANTYTFKLKPCPFCGGKANLSLRINAGWKPYCANCRCQLGVFPTSETAMKAWDSRK